MSEKENATLSILFTNLRLLDLDKYQDWPGDPTASFTGKDSPQKQKARSQYAEWVLYRLYEMWDPRDCVQRLRPFFPPLEPVQSKNLRTALFACLSDLKSQEVFSRSLFFRKSFLEDCKRERLVELLTSFSTAIIQRRLKVDCTNRSSIVHRFCVSRKLPYQSITTMSCLVIAHKISLKAILRQKAVMGVRFREFRELLRQKDDELNNKFEKIIEKQEYLTQNMVSESAVACVASALERNWTGDRRFISCIAEGEVEVHNDPLLGKQFSDVWQSVRSGTPNGESHKGREGLLKDLETRVSEQSIRLQRWKAFREDLRATRTTASVQTDRYTRKRAYTPSRTQHAQNDRQAERELVFSPKKSPRKSTTQQCSVQDRSRNLATSPEGHDSPSSFGQVDIEPNKYLQSPTESPSASPPKLWDGTYGKPFHDIFAPNEHEAERSEGGEVPQWMSEIPWELTAPSTSSQLDTMNAQTDRCSEPLEETIQVKNPEANQACPDALQELDPRLHAREACARDAQPSYASMGHVAQHNSLLADQNTCDSLSLEERTRKTMAMASIGSQIKTATQQDTPAAAPVSETERSPERMPKVTAKATLLERTRQSMSRVPVVPATSNKQLRHQRLSRRYPTNQFETPRKDLSHHDSAITEDLFDSDLDHDSVFKSRPKVALSPSVSPQSRTAFNENEPIRAVFLDDSPLAKLSIRT